MFWDDATGVYKLSEENINSVNQFVKIRDKSKIYTKGSYTVGEQLDAGEIYFWGKNIWYTKKRRKEQDYHEYEGDAYECVKKGDKLLVEEGFFTPIDNIEYLWNKEQKLVPSHIYRLGIEIPSGSYFAKYDQAYISNDVHFDDEDKEKCAFDVYED